MKTEDIIKLLETEAQECRDSAEKNATYGDIFQGIAIVLESIVTKIKNQPTEPLPGSA